MNFFLLSGHLFCFISCAFFVLFFLLFFLFYFCVVVVVVVCSVCSIHIDSFLVISSTFCVVFVCCGFVLPFSC